MNDSAGRRPDDAPESPSVKVLYIAGSGRSGSTILCQILGEIDGFFCTGELSDFWDRYLAENRMCACGKDFGACRVWSHIIEVGMPGILPSEALDIARLHMRIARTQQLPLLLVPALRVLVQGRLTGYMTHLGALYRAIRAGTDCRVIVDSSKFPSYGWILGQVPGIEFFVVHLVRDPRAVAYSWTRMKDPSPAGDGLETPRFGPVSSSLRWVSRNVLAEGLWRRDARHYTLLRYEDLVADPARELTRILKLIGETPAALPLAGDRVRLGENHIVWGNRSRFQRGEVELRLDAEWQTQLKGSSRRIVEAMTWPLIRRYGYTSRIPSSSGSIPPKGPT